MEIKKKKILKNWNRFGAIWRISSEKFSAKIEKELVCKAAFAHRLFRNQASDFIRIFRAGFETRFRCSMADVNRATFSLHSLSSSETSSQNPIEISV